MAGNPLQDEEAVLLAAIDSDARAGLRERGRSCRHTAGGVLLYEGQSNAPVVLILEGHVRVSARTTIGRDLVLAFRGPGSILGEISALNEGVCSATVSAVDAVEALMVSAPAFRAFLRDHPDVAIALLQLTGLRLRDADRKRVEFAELDTVGRVSARIVELATRFGQAEPDGCVAISLALSQEQLASWVGSSREATVKALAQLRGLGWVETGRRRILIRDLDALRRRSIM